MLRRCSITPAWAGACSSRCTRSPRHRLEVARGKPVLEAVCVPALQPKAAVGGVCVIPGDKPGLYLLASPGASTTQHPAHAAAPVAPYPARAARIYSGAGGAVFGPGAPAPAGPALFLLVLARPSAAAAGEAEINPGSPAFAAWAAHFRAAVGPPFSLAPAALYLFLVLDKGDAVVPEFLGMVAQDPLILSGFTDLPGLRPAGLPAGTGTR